MCNYCSNDEVLLSGNIEVLSNLAFFGNSDLDKVYVQDVKQFLENEIIQVFYDNRGYLRLTIGDDIGCLDHSEDRIKINYCPMCGESLIL